MTRIAPLSIDSAQPPAADLLTAAKRKLGMVPNLYATIAHSPATLEGYLSFNAALGRGTLSPALREQIALTVAGANGCDYCASAHTAIGKSVQVDEAELARALDGESSDPRSAAVLRFARQVIESRGHVTDDQLAAVRDAGIDDAQVTEIVGLVAVNTFTNFFNSVARPEIDFPRVELGVRP